MRKELVAAAVILSGVCCGAFTATPAEARESTTLGGRAFFNVSHVSLKNENAAGMDVNTQPTGTAFDIKRFYLIVDHRFNEVWASNITINGQYTTANTAKVNTPTGSTTAIANQNTGDASQVFVQRLYLEGK